MQDYIISLYWASATLTSVGYGDISAHNAREMVFALVVQLIGIILYGYCLGVIAATLTNAASFRSVLSACVCLFVCVCVCVCVCV